MKEGDVLERSKTGSSTRMYGVSFLTGEDWDRMHNEAEKHSRSQWEKLGVFVGSGDPYGWSIITGGFYRSRQASWAVANVYVCWVRNEDGCMETKKRCWDSLIGCVDGSLVDVT